MLWTSIPTNFTGSARPLKPRSGAVAIARSMPSSCVASVPAFLSTRPEGPELSLQPRTAAARTAAARTAAAMGRRGIYRLRHHRTRDRPIHHAQLIEQKHVLVGKTGDALLERGAES